MTHLHGDHIFGLMGLLASCGMAGSVSQMDIYGPPGLDEYLQASRRYSQTHFSYPLRVHTVQPGKVYADDHYEVTCTRLEHRVTAFGYRIQEKDKPGHFDAAKAKALGVPSGPLYGRLKRGETITLGDRTIDGTQLCGEMRPGRTLVYCTDTVYCEGAVQLAQNADVLIHESTYAHQDADMAYERLHSTSTMAAQVALRATAQQLFLTHFSPRYAPGSALQLEDLLLEAQAIFPNTKLAHDFLTYNIPQRT